LTVYALAGLPPDVQSDEVIKLFDGYGRVLECRVMTGFGFIEFENAKDAEDVVNNFNGKPFMGSTIVVEFAKESRPRREIAPRARRPPGVRLIVSGISRDTSWQDLKDFGRSAGSVSFADIDRDNAGQGVLEYLSREDADNAVKDLDGRELRGKLVQVALDDQEQKPGADNYRRDDRDRYRDDRGRDDRYKDDRYSRDDRYRRDRSRSPRRGYEDYGRSRYDDRRYDDPYDRRREDPERKRDDRRRDDKDDRYDERPPAGRHADSGWAR